MDFYTGCCNTKHGVRPPGANRCASCCKICAPPGCCPEMTYMYEVRDAGQHELEISEIVRKNNKYAQQKLPEFDPLGAISLDDDLFFAGGGSCSHPCSTTKVEVKVKHHCCIKNSQAIGKGPVTATVKPSRIKCCKMTLIPYVNGKPNSAFVPDGGTINISLHTRGSGDCPCTLVFKGIKNPCGVSGSPLYIYKRDTSGNLRVSINTVEALDRINRRKKIAAIQRSAILNKNKTKRPRR